MAYVVSSPIATLIDLLDQMQALIEKLNA